MLRKKVTNLASAALNSYGRRCSVCNEKGHRKLACPKLEERVDKRLGQIPVHISHEPVLSPHVVEINHSEAKRALPIFTEKKAPSLHREVMSWEDLIKPELEPENVSEPKPIVSAIVKLPAKPVKTGPSFFQRWVLTWQEKIGSISTVVSEFLAHLSFKKVTWSVVGLIVLAGLPFPAFSYYQKLRTDTNGLVENSVNAFLSLQSSTAAVLHTDLPQAQYDLNAALSSFSQAEAVIEKEHRALVYVASLLPVVGDKVQSRSHILSAGHSVALGNTYLVKGLGEAMASSTTKMDLVDRLGLFKIHVRGAIPHYETALTELAQVKPENLPVEYQSSFQDFRVLFTAVIQDLKNMNSVLSGIETVLGSDQPKRYLVLFQNHHELRATGGFIGSVAIVDVQRGKITNIEVPPGGSYDFKGQLDTYVKAPLPLQMVNARWEFQDANWFPDFPASAQKAAWFYEHSRGATVDGVIAVNASVLERLLHTIGPIKNDQYGVVLSATNALDTLQTIVESGPDKAKNQPKAIIGSVLNQILSNHLEPSAEQLVPLITELFAALTQKEIQIYTTDAKAQVQFAALGWTGEITKTAANQDYLLVVNTNLNGGKTDSRIVDTVEHQAVVQADGSVVDTVIIRRKHTGQADPSSLYGLANSSYLRVYVPRGAELLKASGFIYPDENRFKVPEKWYKTDTDLAGTETERGFHVESGTRITEEFGKTAFGNWITTQPGEETEVWFTYKLPFTIAPTYSESRTAATSAWERLVPSSPASRYTLLIQKQSGTNTEYSTQIIYPNNFIPTWHSRDDYELGTNGARWSGTLLTDELFGVVVKKTDN